MSSDADGQAPAPAPFTRHDLFSFLGALGALLTLATATMYYFGWRRSDVQARAMEMDVTMFGFTTQDYVLRGISSLYAPLLVLGALVIGWLGVHKLVVRGTRVASPPGAAACSRARRTPLDVGDRRDRRDRMRPVHLGGRGSGATVADTTDQPSGRHVAVDRAGPARRRDPDHALRRVDPPPARPRDQSRQATWSTVLVGVVVVGAVALGLFWVLEDYAGTIGRRNAEPSLNR